MIHERETIEVELLLQAIHQLTGYDFRDYSRPSIMRRIHHRMKMNQMDSVSILQNEVFTNKEMLHQLLQDFSINVTEMFRNPLFFKYMREEILPIFKELSEIRIWHAGCSTGEEAFSMAILLKEAGLLEKSKIYATDMNEEVLKIAKEGKIPLSKMKNYTKNYQLSGGKQSFSQYYTTDEEYAYLQEDLVKSISFMQHNLVTDQSFNEFHMILCRNVLIYFNIGLQNKVQKIFFDSLSTGGILGLGHRETLQFTDVCKFYETKSTEHQIYKKKEMRYDE